MESPLKRAKITSDMVIALEQLLPIDILKLISEFAPIELYYASAIFKKHLKKNAPLVYYNPIFLRHRYSISKSHQYRITNTLVNSTNREFLYSLHRCVMRVGVDDDWNESIDYDKIIFSFQENISPPWSCKMCSRVLENSDYPAYEQIIGKYGGPTEEDKFVYQLTPLFHGYPVPHRPMRTPSVDDIYGKLIFSAITCKICRQQLEMWKYVQSHVNSVSTYIKL